MFLHAYRNYMVWISCHECSWYKLCFISDYIDVSVKKIISHLYLIDFGSIWMHVCALSPFIIIIVILVLLGRNGRHCTLHCFCYSRFIDWSLSKWLAMTNPTVSVDLHSSMLYWIILLAWLSSHGSWSLICFPAFIFGIHQFLGFLCVEADWIHSLLGYGRLQHRASAIKGCLELLYEIFNYWMLSCISGLWKSNLGK